MVLVQDVPERSGDEKKVIFDAKDSKEVFMRFYYTIYLASIYAFVICIVNTYISQIRCNL